MSPFVFKKKKWGYVCIEIEMSETWYQYTEMVNSEAWDYEIFYFLLCTFCYHLKF